jgi:hypothetical protein
MYNQSSENQTVNACGLLLGLKPESRIGISYQVSNMQFSQHLNSWMEAQSMSFYKTNFCAAIVEFEMSLNRIELKETYRYYKWIYRQGS